jgi:heme d1 biosynthesis radical SAM protein NirJ
MFRVTQYMKELLSPTPLTPARKPGGPVVIWNLIRRCNLNCKHCYSLSADVDFPGELTTGQVKEVMDDLRAFKVPALILSGGEPLLRPDIFEISAYGKALGFYLGLSSNGTLIDESNIEQIEAAGFDYVGISLDGIGEVHDQFRRKAGAFDASLHAVHLCKERGIKVGLRFTLTQDNYHHLEQLLELLDREDIDKFYLSHLNYQGRGNKNRRDDAHFATTRRALDLIFERCLRDLESGRNREYVTGNNDADGAYLLLWAQSRFPADRVEHLRKKLEQWGGNSSGENIANIDNLGNVHPDTFWWNHTLGNVKQAKFSTLWRDTHDPLVLGMRTHPRPVKGRCADCRWLSICGGNTRVRALQVHGDPWAEDPGCYLDDAEISDAQFEEPAAMIPLGGVQ